MPSYGGEIQLDRPDMAFDARTIATRLDASGVATFRYGAFGTGWRMLAIDQAALTRRGARDLSGVDAGYTLWLRELGNNMSGPWLRRDLEHVPDYLTEKFNVTPTDGYGIAVLIALIDGFRTEVALTQIARRISTWADRLERDDLMLPAFMDNDNPRGTT